MNTQSSCMNFTTPVISGRSSVKSFRLITCFAAVFVSMLPVAHAQTYNWNVSSGIWHAGTNWDTSSVPPFNTTDVIVNLTNGTGGSPAETTFDSGWWLMNSGNSVTVGADNTLTMDITSTNGFKLNHATATFTNNGIVQTATSGAFTYASGIFANNGAIQALSGGTLSMNLTLTNAGDILAKTGGTINFNSSTINNGTVTSEAGGDILQTGDVNPATTVTLNNVTVSNQGTWITNQTSEFAGAGAQTVATNLEPGTVFTNAAGGTTKVLNTGVGDTTNLTTRLGVINVNSGATFTNAGDLLIQNDAARTGLTLGQGTRFAVSSGATSFSSTGTISVINNSTVIGAFSDFTSAQSIINEGVVLVKGNSFDTGASFEVTGAGNDYTQSGGGSQRTVLEQGGLLSVADEVIITNGSLGGVGTVSGDTTIGSGASLIAGEIFAGGADAGVLAFEDSLSLSDNANVEFGLGLNTGTSGQITLAGASGLTLGTGLTLTINDLTGGNWVSGTTYRLFDLGTGGISGDLNDFALNIVPSDWEGTLSSGAGGTDYIDLQLTAIPEPSTMLVLVAGLIALTVFKRRRSQL